MSIPRYCGLLGTALLLLPGFLVESGVAQSDPAPPELLSYGELVELYRQDPLPEALSKKLNRLLSTPFVSNAASRGGTQPLRPETREWGRVLRAALWNIERGLELEPIKLALTDANAYFQLLDKNSKSGLFRDRFRVNEQLAPLQQADVLVLNEVDWGMKRTDYRNVVQELAEALKMNYAYGVEFVEIDPLALGIEEFREAPEAERKALVENIKVDESRYLGLHGSAILSRYPLENVRLWPLDYQGHDWYGGEMKRVTQIEVGKRKISEKVFLEKVGREIRRGGRMMLLADISDPDFPGGKVTIVNTHLEARTKPENRVRQLREVLHQIADIRHPVILAGDMNTSTKDTTPTSIQREIRKRLGSQDFWLKQGIKYATGVGLLLDVVTGGLNFARSQGDPTVRHIPVVASNPESAFFELLEAYRFADGGAFDFRGETSRSFAKREGTLANSNERENKGFVTTYQVSRSIGPAGKFKLDWFFIKPGSLADPRDAAQPHRFAPHFGRTLSMLNYSYQEGLSDHSPMIVDLPLQEPAKR